MTQEQKDTIHTAFALQRFGKLNSKVQSELANIVKKQQAMALNSAADHYIEAVAVHVTDIRKEQTLQRNQHLQDLDPEAIESLALSQDEVSRDVLRKTQETNDLILGEIYPTMLRLSA